MKPRHSANSTPKTNMAEVMHRIGYHVTVWTLAWLLCACVCPVHCGVDKRCPSTDIQMSSQGICGNQLSNILQILCGSGGYNKRSVPEPKPEASPLSKHLFLSKSEASSYLGRSRRSPYTDIVQDSVNSFQGIVCECCHHSCSIMELSQYCMNPDDNLAIALYSSRQIGKRKFNNWLVKSDNKQLDSTTARATTVAERNRLVDQKPGEVDSIKKAFEDTKSVINV